MHPRNSLTVPFLYSGLRGVYRLIRNHFFKARWLLYRSAGPRGICRWMAQNNSKPILLHVGAAGNVLKGWLNTDYTRHPGCIFLDVTKSLPFQNGSIDAILAEHVIAILSKEGTACFFREAFRCLRVGGILRVSTPNLTALCRALSQPELEPERGRLVQRHQRVNRNGEALSYCDFFNDVVHMWGHKYLFSEAELFGQLQMAGFKQIRMESFGQSVDERLCGVEVRPEAQAISYINLIVEAVKE